MIEQVIVENFKSIKYAQITLKPLNVFIGYNGVGKSNFISFLEFGTETALSKFGKIRIGSWRHRQAALSRSEVLRPYKWINRLL